MSVRRVNTKIVLDIETGEVLERESYSYEGPWALATNVTSTLQASTPGVFINLWQQAISATDFSAIDFYGGGYGATLLPYQWLSMQPLISGDFWTLSSARDIFNSCFPRAVTGDGEFGTRKLEDGTETTQLFAPWDWMDPFENLVSDTPLPPPPPPIGVPNSLMMVGMGI